MSEADVVTLMLAIGFVASVGFVIDYARSVNVRSPVGRHLLAFGIALVVLFGVPFARRIFDPENRWDTALTLSIALVDVMILDRWRLLRRARRRRGVLSHPGRRADDD